MSRTLMTHYSCIHARLVVVFTGPLRGLNTSKDETHTVIPRLHLTQTAIINLAINTHLVHITERRALLTAANAVRSHRFPNNYTR